MTDDLIASLRSLAAAKHDDLSVAADAADEIERLRADNEKLTRKRDEARAEVERLRASLKPFAQLYLWPDDLGEDMATLLRSEADWCEATNEDADSDVFIKRKYIRAARAALEAQP